jgi:hypothetical protein
MWRLSDQWQMLESTEPVLQSIGENFRLEASRTQQHLSAFMKKRLAMCQNALKCCGTTKMGVLPKTKQKGASKLTCLCNSLQLARTELMSGQLLLMNCLVVGWPTCLPAF